MIEKLLIKLRCYDKVSATEEQALADACTHTQDIRRGGVIVRGRTELDYSCLLISGFAHRYRDFKDGRRQSMELGIPGDFLDLHSFVMKRIDHDVGALTDCRIAIFPHDRLRELTSRHDHLGRLLWLLTIIDAAIHREWIVSLGARSAAERMAHLFCETQSRLEPAGLAARDRFDFPLTQFELSEILGMSPVHINRTLKQLRERGLATFRDKQVVIDDHAGLVALAEFDPLYLGMDRRPR